MCRTIFFGSVLTFNAHIVLYGSSATADSRSIYNRSPNEVSTVFGDRTRHFKGLPRTGKPCKYKK